MAEESMKKDEREFIKQGVEDQHKRNLRDKQARALRFIPQQFAPAHYFAQAVVECRDMYVDGHFYGCITLAQAVAEAIARFVTTQHPELNVAPTSDFGVLVSALHRKEPVISNSAHAAFKQIWGQRKGKNDRNDYHHLTDAIELDSYKLEVRARQCLRALREIEKNIFGYTFKDGMIVVEKPKYWKLNGDHAHVMVR
jgi:hypothetical protein